MTRGGTYTETVAGDELALEAVGIVRDVEFADAGDAWTRVRHEWRDWGVMGRT